MSTFKPSRDADLAIIATLIVLTAALGGTFSKLSIGGQTIYITEILLAAAAVVAIARLGLSRGIEAIRVLPLVPLGIYVAAGLIATARGLLGEGLELTIEDVGLFEYALVLPLVALIATSIERVDLLIRAILLGAGVATVIYFVSQILIRAFDEASIAPEAVANGIFMVALAAWVWAQFGQGRRPHPALSGLAAIAVVLAILTNVRAIWIGILAAAVVSILLAPAERRLRFALGSIAALAAALAIAVAVEALEGEIQIFREVEGATAGVRDPGAGLRGPDDIAPEAGSKVDGTVGLAGGETVNIRWRLAFWEELTERTVSQPLLGAGFGEPTRFTWEGLRYDFRDGIPTEKDSVTGPHNSLIYVMYRMGFPAAIALIALLWIAFRRARDPDPDDPEQRARLAGLFAMTAAALGVALFNDAWKNPYLALPFWIPLGLLLVAGALGVRSRARASTDGPARGPA